MPVSTPVSLTPSQKLQALALRFYHGSPWSPKAGDYYTTSRNDLELYHIAKIEDGLIHTEYCTQPGQLSQWPEAGFTTEGFGAKRVWVPPFVLEGDQ